MFDIVALGELLVDFEEIGQDQEHYPRFQAHPGGAPANLLATAATCGRKTALIGKVGDDVFGHLLTDTLARLSVSCEYIVSDPSVFTTLAFVALDETGERSFSFARKPGADACLRADEVPYSLFDQTRIFHFGTLSLTDEPIRSATFAAIAYAQEAGCLISFDPNYREMLWDDEARARDAMEWGLRQCSIAKLSADEAAFLWGLAPEAAARKAVNDYGCSLVFCTMGKQGCCAATPQMHVKISPSVTVKAKDCTGAGDIFTGAALSKLLWLSNDPADLTCEQLWLTVSFASAMASLSTTKPGSITSIPDPRHVRTLLT